MYCKQSIFKFPLYVASLLCSLLSAGVHAEVEHRFLGYASFGLVSNDNEDLGFRRDLTQNNGARDGELTWKTDSLVALQWNAKFNHQFDTVVQVVARDRFKNSFEQSLEWAFVRYRPQDGLDIRVGRLGSDIFMVSDHRQVSYALKWVRPPVDYYGWLALYYFDGIDVSKRFDIGNATVNAKLFYGNTNETYPTTYDAEGAELDFYPGGLSLTFEWGNWRGRYTYSDVSIKNNYLQPLTDLLETVGAGWAEGAAWAEELDPSNKTMTYNEVGLGWDNNTWWMQTEYTTLTSTTRNILPSTYFYFSLGRRIQDFTVYGIYGFVEPDTEYTFVDGPVGLPPLYAQQLAPAVIATELTINSSYLDQKSLGVGVRWDFAIKKALKFQVEKYDIAANGSNLWLNFDNVGFTEDQSATVISVSLDVLF